MAYIRRNWVNGEVITDEKLNNIEEGIAEAMKKAEDAELKLDNAGDDAETAKKAIDAHIADKKNPHNVTAAQLGLGNVPNVGTNDQTPTYTEATTLANIESGEKLNIAFGKIKHAITNLIGHLNNKNNPHAVTAAQVGLGSVTNVSTNDQTPTYTEATTLATLQSGERLSVAFGKLKLALTNLINHLNSKNNPHTVTAEQVGLGNVPNKATNDQTPTYTEATTLATLESGEKLSVAFGKLKLALTNLIDHLTNKSNPHEVTAAQLGAGTFPETGVCAKTGTDYDTPRIRNIQASSTNLTAGTSSLSNGDLYYVFE